MRKCSNYNIQAEKRTYARKGHVEFEPRKECRGSVGKDHLRENIICLEGEEEDRNHHENAEGGDDIDEDFEEMCEILVQKPHRTSYDCNLGALSDRSGSNLEYYHEKDCGR